MSPASTQAMTTQATNANANGSQAPGCDFDASICSRVVPRAVIQGFASAMYQIAPAIQPATAAMNTAR